MNSKASLGGAAFRSGASLHWLASVLLFLPLSVPARALDPDRNISQYAHTAWRVQDGFFPGTPTAITQTKDGYLWIGTTNGLLRFDGVRFTPWVPPSEKRLSSQVVYSVRASKDGGLWIGLSGSLAHWNGKDLENYSLDGRVDAIAEDERGIPWVVRTRTVENSGPLCELSDKQFRCHGIGEGISIPTADAMVRGGQGDFWIGGASNLARWSAGAANTYPIAGIKNTDGLADVLALAIDQDGTVWVGMGVTGKGLGLAQFSHGQFKSFVRPDFDGSQINVSSLFVDRDHSLWVGTLSDGIYRIHGDKVEHFRSSDGLSGDTIGSFAQDEEGNIWVVTSRGVDGFRDLPVITYSHQQGLTADSAGSVMAASDGTIWIGNTGGLDYLRNGIISSIRVSHGLPGGQVTSLLQDHAGELWVGVDNGVFLVHDGRFKPITTVDGRPSGFVSGLAEDEHHDIWTVAYRAGISRLMQIRGGKAREAAVSTPSQVQKVFPDPSDGVWISLRTAGFTSVRQGKANASILGRTRSFHVSDLLAESNDLVWAATSSGVVALSKGVPAVLNEQNGLPCHAIYSIALDKSDALWLYAQCGLIRIDKKDWEQWLTSPNTKVPVHIFGVLCGAQPAGTSFLPANATTQDGRLWFTNDYVLQMIDPQHLHLNPLPPPVHIERISADGSDYVSNDGLQLPPRPRNIEIDYTALSFVMPQAVAFRYKLEGRDADWQEAGTRRQALYNDLRPGHYRFRVIACNNDQVWNQTGAAIEFSIRPAWYQTYSFRIAVLISLIWLAFILYRIQIRSYAKSMAARFDEQLRERTRLARELHDTLLQTIQGSKMVADEAREVRTDPVRMRATLDRLSDWLERANVEGRAALDSLRTSSIETNDLSSALRDVATDCEINHAFEVHLSVFGKPKEMHPIVREEVLRIGTEAIRNASMHSGGSHLNIKLEYQQDFSLEVRDDGHGMEKETISSGKRGHFGLLGMRERADRIGGKLSIVSASDGTKVSLSVPGRYIFRTT